MTCNRAAVRSWSCILPRAAANQSIKIPFRLHLQGQPRSGFCASLLSPPLSGVRHSLAATLLFATLICTLLTLYNLCSCNICHMYYEEL